MWQSDFAIRENVLISSKLTGTGDGQQLSF